MFQSALHFLTPIHGPAEPWSSLNSRDSISRNTKGFFGAPSSGRLRLISKLPFARSFESSRSFRVNSYSWTPSDARPLPLILGPAPSGSSRSSDAPAGSAASASTIVAITEPITTASIRRSSNSARPAPAISRPRARARRHNPRVEFTVPLFFNMSRIAVLWSWPDAPPAIARSIVS